MKDLERYFTPLAIELMQEHNINLNVLGYRLAGGATLDEAFSFKNRGRKTIYPEWAFKKAMENGISRQTLYHRTKVQGLSIREAVTLPVGRKRPKASGSAE